MPSGTLRIVLGAPDGTVAIDIPTRKTTSDPERLSLHLKRLRALGYTILKQGTVADLPNARVGQSRRFRNQWRWVGAKIEPYLPLCRDQLMAELRVERDRRLAETDGVMTRDLELGQPDQALAAHRQALRDLPAAVESDLQGKTAAELEAYDIDWPTEDM